MKISKINSRQKLLLFALIQMSTKKGLENAITSHPAGSILHYNCCSFFAFNENILSDLKTNVEIFNNKNLESKNINIAIITDEAMINVLKNLQFVSDYLISSKKYV